MLVDTLSQHKYNLLEGILDVAVKEYLNISIRLVPKKLQ